MEIAQGNSSSHQPKAPVQLRRERVKVWMGYQKGNTGKQRFMSKNSWNEEKSMRGTNKKLCNRSYHLHGSFVDIPEKHPTVGDNAVLLDFIYNKVTALWGLSGAQNNVARRCIMYGFTNKINRETNIANIGSTLSITEVILLIFLLAPHNSVLLGIHLGKATLNT